MSADQLSDCTRKQSIVPLYQHETCGRIQRLEEVMRARLCQNMFPCRFACLLKFHLVLINKHQCSMLACSLAWQPGAGTEMLRAHGEECQNAGVMQNNTGSSGINTVGESCSAYQRSQE